MSIIKAGRSLVQNAFSFISAGTERSSVELARKSLLGKAKFRLSLVSHKSEKDGFKQFG